MLIQQALSEKKIVESRINRNIKDLAKYAAYESKTNHPLGKDGADNYSKQKAEAEVAALFQGTRDLVTRLTVIKEAIQRTNLETKIVVGGKEMSLAMALSLRGTQSITGDVNYIGQVIHAVDSSVTAAQNKVAQWNSQKDLGSESKHDVWYLFDREDLEKDRKFYQDFMLEIDGAIQIANATVHVIGLE